MRSYIPVFSPDWGKQERSAAAEHFLKDEFGTAHKHVNEFQDLFKARHGRRHAVMTNSGTSAVEIAIAACELRPGYDRVITPAVGFATTIAPLVRAGVEMIFIDVEEGTYNIDLEKMVDVIFEQKATTCVVPHTMGNPVDTRVWPFFRHSIEDACDALDSSIGGEMCGTFGNLSCFSFFAAHHITTLQGGMVLGNEDRLMRKVYQYASWGRACWCRAGQDNLCKNRFDHIVDGFTYDHKYIFDVPGFNVAPLDVCGVVGKIQLDKATTYKSIRKYNYDVLDAAFADLDDLIVRPKSLPEADPNWFGYPITLKKGRRKDITERIENRGVATRLLFGGNITRHPMMKTARYSIPHALVEADRVMRDAFIVPMNHTLTEDEIRKVATVVSEEIKRG